MIMFEDYCLKFDGINYVYHLFQIMIVERVKQLITAEHLLNLYFSS